MKVQKSGSSKHLNFNEDSKRGDFLGSKIFSIFFSLSKSPEILHAWNKIFIMSNNLQNSICYFWNDIKTISNKKRKNWNEKILHNVCNVFPNLGKLHYGWADQHRNYFWRVIPVDNFDKDQCTNAKILIYCGWKLWWGN